MDKKGHIWYINEEGKYCRLFEFMVYIIKPVTISDIIKFELDFDNGQKLIREVNECKIEGPYILDQHCFGDNESIVMKHHKLGNLQEINKEEIISGIKEKINEIERLKELITLSEEINMGNICTNNIIVDFGITKCVFTDSEIYYLHSINKIGISTDIDCTGTSFEFDDIKEGYKIIVSYKDSGNESIYDEPHLLVEFIEK